MSMIGPFDFGDGVRALVLIEQPPCAEAPDVPAGTTGFVADLDDDDEDDPRVLVEFGKPWGLVNCSEDDLEPFHETEKAAP